jgi:predicted NBD/HSP70 family sugar kinase
MRRVSIRDLSADIIRNCASDNEILGIASKGALVGVLVPLTHDTIRRLASNDADELAAAAASADVGAGPAPTSLRDVLRDPAPAPGRTSDFSRVSIREITGARLEQASGTGTPLVVTSDRVAVAVFLPLVSGWVDRLVEESVARFLSGGLAGGSEPAVENAPDTHLIRTSGRRFTSQRAIGIRIVGDARGDRERIVGVVTDGLARIKVDQITLPLERLDEAYVFEQILTLIDMLSSRMGDTDDLVGVGIEIGGHVSEGRVVHSTNIRWDQFPIADQLSEIVGVPVVLENDANALAIHERYSEGISADNFAVVLLTHLGVGCGLVVDGRLHRGSRGMAGEFGHLPIATAGSVEHPCRCGNPDCLEAVATPQAIEVMLHKRKFKGSYEDALKESQQQVVQEVFAEAGAALGKGIATVLNLLNPEAIVLYGPLDVVGPPRQFHVDNFEAVAEAKEVTRIGRIYTGAMMNNIRSHVFSNAAEECQFIVRVRSDEQGAKAAAACVIRAVRDRSAVGPLGRVPAYAERDR